MRGESKCVRSARNRRVVLLAKKRIFLIARYDDRSIKLRRIWWLADVRAPVGGRARTGWQSEVTATRPDAVGLDEEGLPSDLEGRDRT